ncbi:MAG: 1,4-dihydroxy-2-naphthoate polyprenyltransferase [Anaerolineae bacterium]|jgi:1,4-dihydroxy-2-naphthoate octaprenyltransferase|nr:1,4-dihydroxy-2-naphthoate polyprenyltransferase [Anaerolineae bacterium]
MKENLIVTNSFQPWILGARPKTLPAAISPILIGIGIAVYYNSFRLAPALAALVCAIFIQIGTNYVNDVVDYLNGHDQTDRLGPLRVTQAGLLSSKQVIFGAVASFGVAIIAGLYLATVAGWIVLIIGAACILAGLAYSTGPAPLINNGLADLFVLVFFGFVAVVSTVFVITAFIPPESWLGGLAAGALSVNILVVNNIRDVVSDKRAGRKNIPVLYGRRAGEKEYLVMLAIAYLVPLAMFFILHLQPWVLVTYLTLPVAIKNFRELKRTPDGKLLNLQLAKTAQMVFVYSAVMTGGFLLGRFLG